MSKPRALVTGAAGFLGSQLQEKLEKDGWEVIGLDNLRWSTRQLHNLVIGDILDTKLVDFLVSQSDEVYHLAAQINVDYGNEHPEDTVDINVKGTLNILEACKKHEKKLIFASTSEVYGSAQTDSIAETHPLCPQSIYAASKASADRLCFSYVQTFGVDARILRNFNTFGRYQRFDSYGGVIAIFVDRALHNKSPIIFGDGLQERDYISTVDALSGYELIAASGRPGEPVNFGTGRTVTVNHIAELIQKYTGCPDPIHTSARPGEVRRLCADISQARKLGFNPTTDFEEELRLYIEWRKHELAKVG